MDIFTLSRSESPNTFLMAWHGVTLNRPILTTYRMKYSVPDLEIDGFVPVWIDMKADEFSVVV